MAAMVRLAAEEGAEIAYETPVRGLEPGDDGVRFEAGGETWQAETLVVAAGGWTGPLLGCGLVPLPPLTVTQQQVFYFDRREAGPWPTIVHGSAPESLDMFALPEGPLLKVGEHMNGTVTTADDRRLHGRPGGAGTCPRVRTGVAAGPRPGPAVGDDLPVHLGTGRGLHPGPVGTDRRLLAVFGARRQVRPARRRACHRSRGGRCARRPFRPHAFPVARTVAAPLWPGGDQPCSRSSKTFSTSVRGSCRPRVSAGIPRVNPARARAGDVVVAYADVIGDGPAEGGGVPRPHAFGVLPQRRCGVHESGELGPARVGRHRDPGREDVLAQRVDDALTGGALAYRGDQLRLVVLLLVEDQRLLAREVLEQRCGRHVGRFGDVPDAHPVIAPLQEQPQGGVGDRLTGGGLLAFTATDDGWLVHAPTLPKSGHDQLVERLHFSTRSAFLDHENTS